MKNPLYLGLAALLALAGCGDKGSMSHPDNFLAGNDFESLEGWTADAPMPSLTKVKAHSGVYSLQVGPGIEYSNGFANSLGKLTPSRIEKIQVKAWVYLPTGSHASLVTQLMNPAVTDGKPVQYDAMPLEKAVKKPNEWTEVEKTITLPANAGPDFKLYVYMWNAGSASIAYIDDVQILKSK